MCVLGKMRRLCARVRRPCPIMYYKLCVRAMMPRIMLPLCCMLPMCRVLTVCVFGVSDCVMHPCAFYMYLTIGFSGGRANLVHLHVQRAATPTSPACRFVYGT